MMASSNSALPGFRSSLNWHPELWQACAPEQVDIPAVDSNVYYFVQGHAEQSALIGQPVDWVKIVNTPYRIPCKVARLDYWATGISDDIFTIMTLLPLSPGKIMNSDSELNSAPPLIKREYLLLPEENGKIHLTNECVTTFFPQASEGSDQNVSFKDVHGLKWKCKLTWQPGPVLTGRWGDFVRAKRLVSGEHVVLMRDRDGELRIGLRRGRMNVVMKKGAHSVEEAVELAAKGAHLAYSEHVGV